MKESFDTIKTANDSLKKQVTVRKSILNLFLIRLIIIKTRFNALSVYPEGRCYPVLEKGKLFYFHFIFALTYMTCPKYEVG